MKYIAFIVCCVLTSCTNNNLKCQEEFINPFNNMFIRKSLHFECLKNSDFELSNDEDEIRNLFFDSDSLKINLEIKLGYSKNDDEFEKNNFEIYGIKYHIKNLLSLDSLIIKKRLEYYDTNIISKFIYKDNRYFYFFVQHEFNNLIFICYGDCDLKQIEVPIIAPVLDVDEIQRRRENYKLIEEFY